MLNRGFGMSTTHHTAVVAIPPRDIWEPIQAIRRVHDRQVRRWMPHVNLLYPFVEPHILAAAAAALADVCRDVRPFRVRLAEFRTFRHPSGSHTIWLAPEPPEALVDLQARLQARFPGCDDISRFPTGFTPHLSVGQVPAGRPPHALLAELRGAWRPLEFELTSIAAIRRDRKGPFKVAHEVALAGSVR